MGTWVAFLLGDAENQDTTAEERGFPIGYLVLNGKDRLRMLAWRLVIKLSKKDAGPATYRGTIRLTRIHQQSAMVRRERSWRRLMLGVQ